MFEGTIGPIKASELIAMPEDTWGLLRDRLTDGRHSPGSGLVAKCMMCSSEVFIRTRRMNGKPLPLFAHFKGGDPTCRWRHQSTSDMDQVRANQYGGRQEFSAHRMLCEKIEELVKADPRYVTSAVDEYLAPTENAFGRYPDVYVEWRGFSPFAIEIQLSNTFETEISHRCLHYDREGVTLIWVLFGTDPWDTDLPQNYRDVIRRHHGNAFTLDKDAIAASHEQKTLVLKCFLKNAADKFDAPILVRLDQLTFPQRGLAYFEDRFLALQAQRIDAIRKPWFKALSDCPEGLDRYTLSDGLVSAVDDLRRVIPVLTDLEATKQDQDFEIARLIAIVFSIIATANKKERNYATRHPNIKSMLNTMLNLQSGIGRYASIIEELLRHSRLDYLLDDSVGEHIDRAKRSAGNDLCLKEQPEWKIMAHLVPEVFDSVICYELSDFDAFPPWATPSKKPKRTLILSRASPADVDDRVVPKGLASGQRRPAPCCCSVTALDWRRSIASPPLRGSAVSANNSRRCLAPTGSRGRT